MRLAAASIDQRGDLRDLSSVDLRSWPKGTESANHMIMMCDTGLSTHTIVTKQDDKMVRYSIKLLPNAGTRPRHPLHLARQPTEPFSLATSI